jgi:hypothetical protein
MKLSSCLSIYYHIDGYSISQVWKLKGIIIYTKENTGSPSSKIERQNIECQRIHVRTS